MTGPFGTAAVTLAAASRSEMTRRELADARLPETTRSEVDARIAAMDGRNDIRRPR